MGLEKVLEHDLSAGACEAIGSSLVIVVMGLDFSQL